jgi:hypothetical protein
VKQTEQSSNGAQYTSLRSILLLTLFLALAAAAIFVYARFFTTVSYDAVLLPEQIAAYAGAEGELRVYGISRAGTPSSGACRIAEYSVLEGGHLATLQMDESGTTLRVIANGGEGVLRLRIMIPDWPLPLLAEIPLLLPHAQSIHVYHDTVDSVV